MAIVIKSALDDKISIPLTDWVSGVYLVSNEKSFLDKIIINEDGSGESQRQNGTTAMVFGPSQAYLALNTWLIQDNIIIDRVG